MFRKMEKKRKRGEKRRKERHDANGYGKVAQKGEVGRERERAREERLDIGHKCRS